MNNFIIQSVGQSLQGPEDEAIAKSEAPSDKVLYEYQFQMLVNHGYDVLASSDAIYSITSKLYLVVMKPLDKFYMKKQWFHEKGIDKLVRKLRTFGVQDYATSTEVLASKVHQNGVFRCSDPEILLEHDKIWYNKWKIYVQPLKGSLMEALTYIYKEAKYRTYHLYWDYSFSQIKSEIRRKPLSRPKVHGTEVDGGTSVVHPHRDPGVPDSHGGANPFIMDLVN